jgi:hypothetical protein
MEPWRPKKGTRKNLEAFFTKTVREILHGNNICYMNHEIDIEVLSPSRGRVRIFFDGKRSDYLEEEVLQRYERWRERNGDIPQMQWHDVGRRDMVTIPVED